MAIRNLLHFKHLEPFREWLQSEGYEIQKPKGEYEVLRAKKDKHTVIIFEKLSATQHYSVPEQSYHIVRRFLNELTV